MADTFQWEHSPDGVTYTDILGATGSTYMLSGEEGNDVRARGTRDAVLVGESNVKGPIAAALSPSGKYWGIAPGTPYVPSLTTQADDFLALGATCPRFGAGSTLPDPSSEMLRSKGFTTWVVWAGNTGYMWTPSQGVAYLEAYPECIAIELGNELNLNSAWTTSSVAAMQQAFWAAAVSAGVQSRVMLPSVGNSPSAVQHLSMIDWCKGLDAQGLTPGNGFTIANYHNYGADPVSADDWNHCWTPNGSGDSCQSVFGDPPFLVTEFGAKIGWSGVTASTQATAATAWVQKLNSLADCIGGQWFLDYDGSAWTGFGLRDGAGSVRPSYAAFQSALAAA